MACKSKTSFTLLFILLLWAWPALAPAVTPPVPAHPSQYVVDLAKVIDANTTARLNAMLKDLEAKTTAQVVVLTINSLDGEPIENFSHQTAVKWGIGQKGKDNGALITVAVKDRKYRIEVGYGLESTLPDSLVGSLGRQFLAPNFRKGDYAGGLLAAVQEIVNKISGGKVDPKAGGGTPPYHGENVPKKKSASLNPLTLILLIIFMIMLLVVFILSRPWVWFFGGGWSGGGSGWSSGGGDSGGFSGGGGDFGGGGASGDW